MTDKAHQAMTALNRQFHVWQLITSIIAIVLAFTDQWPWVWLTLALTALSTLTNISIALFALLAVTAIK